MSRQGTHTGGPGPRPWVRVQCKCSKYRDGPEPPSLAATIHAGSRGDRRGGYVASLKDSGLQVELASEHSSYHSLARAMVRHAARRLVSSLACRCSLNLFTQPPEGTKQVLPKGAGPYHHSLAIMIASASDS